MNRLETVMEIVAGRRPPVKLDDPLQRPELFAYPGLESRPVWDTGRFDWATSVERAYARIRDEVQDLLRSRRGFRTVWKDTTAAGAWAAMWLFLYEKPYLDNAALCPETVGILSYIPRRTGWACFSAMAPGTHVRAHCGTTNAKLRCHLPLQVPDGCRMRVGEQFVQWTPGKLLIFDDSFEHEVWTGGAYPRIVLVFDVYHPDLRMEERVLLDAVQKRHDLAGSVDRDSGRGVQESAPCSWVYDG